MAQLPLVSTHFPYVPVTISVRGHTHEAEALLDTGFTGYVVVPTGLVTNGEPPDARLQYSLADGSLVTAPVYRGTIEVGAFGPFPTLVTVLADEPIVGRELMDRFRITLEHGQRIVVEP
jgi:predicted aspartyl protease